MLARVIGDDAAILAIRAQAARLVAAERLPPVLIQGETGSGKTLLARELHAASPRARAPFVSINCAAIPETLLEAELFGVERGAFTDARESKPGLLQTAHGGTLFLDEIGYLPLALQPKLLTVIEEWRVRRVGGTRAETVDVWLIAATSEDLERAIGEQRFLRALYHRLGVMTFRVPALRERVADLPALASQLLRDVCRTYGLPAKQLASDAIAELRRHSWPGNVRELANVLERAALLGDGPSITAAMLGKLADEAADVARAPAIGRYRKKSDDERSELVQALAEAHGNVSEAARLLGLPRNTLRYRLKRHGLMPDATPAAPAAPEPPTTSPAPRWERQKLAVLTAVLEPAGAGTWLDRLDEKIELFGGRLLDRDDTQIIAVFGLGAIEDGARRAVLAALTTMQTDDGASLGIDIELDDAVVARSDGNIIIDPGVLARARTRARPPSARGVWVSSAAAQALRRHVRIVTRDGRPFVDADHTTPGAPASELVGRAAELLLLEARAHVAAAGSGQIVGVAGPPGIGKSRLIGELHARIAPAHFTTVEARCAAHASSFAYYSIAELVRGLAGLPVGADVAVARKSLSGLLDHDAVGPLLNVLDADDSAATTDAAATRTRGIAAIVALVRRVAEQRPVVMIVEDVHWADASSRAALERIAEGLDRVPALLVVTYRPEAEPGFMTKAFATRIALARLSADESRGLVGALLPTTQPPDVVERIVDRAEGNPLFLEELALAVREGNSLVTVPDGIHDVLRMRIERLSDAERRLLQIASVLGRELREDLLAALWDAAEPLEPLLDALDRADLLYPARGARVFKHALTRDVAYESLVEADRAHLHERAARAIEAAHHGGMGDVCELLAYHYARSTNDDKAVELLALAQARTYRRFALDQAVAYYREASARLAKLPETPVNVRRRVDLELGHCDAIGYLAELEEYRASLDTATALAKRVGDPVVMTKVRSRRGFFQWWIGEYQGAIEELEPNLRFAADSIAEEYNSGVFLLNAYVVVGRYASALELGPRLLPKLVARGSVIHKAYARGALVWTLGECGRFRDAFAEAETSLAEAQASGDPAAITFAAWSASRVYGIAGELARAAELAKLAVDRAVTPLDTLFAKLTAGWVACRAGGEPALATLEEIHARAMAVRWQIVGAWCALPDAYCALRRWDDARRSLEEHVALTTRYGMHATVASIQRRLGEVALATGDLAAARDWLDRALRVHVATGGHYERALTEAALGMLETRHGEATGAARRAAAIAELEQMGAQFDVARLRAS